MVRTTLVNIVMICYLFLFQIKAELMFFGAPIKDVRLMRKSSGEISENIFSQLGVKQSVCIWKKNNGSWSDSLTEVRKF